MNPLLARTCLAPQLHVVEDYRGADGVYERRGGVDDDGSRDGRDITCIDRCPKREFGKDGRDRYCKHRQEKKRACGEAAETRSKCQAARV